MCTHTTCERHREVSTRRRSGSNDKDERYGRRDILERRMERDRGEKTGEQIERQRRGAKEQTEGKRQRGET
jgi:hypothetical protein